MDSSFRVGCVIPTAENRLENLELVLQSLAEQIYQPEHVVVVCDGFSIEEDQRRPEVTYVSTSKHEPGMIQPRNIGVRTLEVLGGAKCNYVWFLDSDCLTVPNTLAEYHYAFNEAPAIDRIFIGPYEWMGGSRVVEPTLKNDMRWDMFDRYGRRTTFIGHLGVALGNFSGNLVWPINEFKRVGGFWNMLHHGRCEDGELGIRACAMNVPMCLVKDARAFHMQHEVNTASVVARNERDVPMINERHPYVEGEGLVVVDQDGKRFNYQCPYCGEEINTAEIWSHDSKCNNDVWE